MEVQIMQVFIEVTEPIYNDRIVQVFTDKHIQHDKDLVFSSDAGKEEYFKMFSAMLELIKNDDIFPLLTKMEFIDENGSVEDILRLSLDIGKKTKMVYYDYGEPVLFDYYHTLKIGNVWIIDAHGTFDQNEEVSYDIYVEEENCIYKHVRQSFVIKSMRKYN